MPLMITPAQCRMARAALQWTVQELAAKAHVSRATVSRFELEQGPANQSTQALLRQTFEAAGVELIDENGGGPGVRLRKPVSGA